MVFAVPAQGETINPIGPVSAGNNPAAPAGIDWQWTHEASGWGEARVFDNGPLVTDSDTTTGPNDDRMRFSAFDSVGSGANSASYLSGGESRVTINDEGLFFSVDFVSNYGAVGPPGGPRPGGRGQGKLSSTFEFVMPSEAPLLMNLFMFIVVDPGYDGETLVTIHNVTQSRRLFTLNSFNNLFEILDQPTGDLIRVTAEISGGASLPQA